MPNRVTLSEQVADRVRELRNQASLSREQLAEAARAHGAAEDFTHQSVTFLENGRPQNGVRTRLFTLDEMWALAEALEVTPLELLGGDAALFVGDSATLRVVCPSCSASPGPLEMVTRDDLEGLGDLTVLEATLVETAFRLAGAIDEAKGAEAARSLPALTKELRATLEQIAAGRRRNAEADEDDFGDLDDPE